jgi:hypothetical protein
MRQTTGNGCTVTVIASRASYRADVQITGDVDMAALPVLADAVSQLAAASPRSVFVDLAGVTFAGSALPDFWPGRTVSCHVSRPSWCAAPAR